MFLIHLYNVNIELKACILCSNGLEITTANEKIDRSFTSPLGFANNIVNQVQVTVTASFNSHAYTHRKLLSPALLHANNHKPQSFYLQ
jgi:hypothetical protein